MFTCYDPSFGEVISGQKHRSASSVFAYYTPGIYEVHVYRGYIVFGFSVKMFVCVCVCVCKLFFLSKISLELLDIG